MAGGDLLGVLLGGAIGVAGSWVPHWWQQRRAKASARALAGAYISGILEIMARRQHAEHYRKNLDNLRSGATTSFYKIYGMKDPNSLYTDKLDEAIIAQIGYLEPDVAKDIVIFSTYFNGIRTTLRTIASGDLDSLSNPDKIKLIERNLGLWDDTQTRGQSLLARLNRP
jgi:hypothetical protein